MYHKSLSHQIKDIINDSILEIGYDSIFDVDNFVGQDNIGADTNTANTEISTAAPIVNVSNSVIQQPNNSEQQTDTSLSTYDRSRNKNEIISGFENYFIVANFDGTAAPGNMSFFVLPGTALDAEDDQVELNDIQNIAVLQEEISFSVGEKIKRVFFSMDNNGQIIKSGNRIEENFQIASLNVFSGTSIVSPRKTFMIEAEDTREILAKIKDISKHNHSDTAHNLKFMEVYESIDLVFVQLSGTIEALSETVSGTIDSINTLNEGIQTISGTVENHTQQISALSGTLQQARETLSIISENYVPVGNFSAENLIVLTSGTDPSGTPTLKIETTIKRGIEDIESFADSQPIVVTGTINYISGTSVTCSIVNNSTGARLIPEIDVSPEEPIEFKIYNLSNENIPSGTFEIHWNMI